MKTYSNYHVTKLLLKVSLAVGFLQKLPVLIVLDQLTLMDQNETEIARRRSTMERRWARAGGFWGPPPGKVTRKSKGNARLRASKQVSIYYLGLIPVPVC